MKRSGWIMWIRALPAAALAAAVLAVALFCRDAEPVLLHAPEQVTQQAEAVMDALCRGDFQGAQTLFYGSPDLGAGRTPADPVGAMFWEAWVESLDYTLVGQVYATDTGLAQDVKIIHLELDTALARLGHRARELLQEAIDQAEDVSELYDENNGYREDLVRQILEEAAAQALEEDVRYTYQVVPLHFVLSEGTWQPVADQQLLDCLSGGVTE